MISEFVDEFAALKSTVPYNLLYLKIMCFPHFALASMLHN